ncbi:MAG: hypothetical protein PUB42_01125, partial [Firmicutes bacterium]|nr:hypothetical protein [Bacillota bacterium]
MYNIKKFVGIDRDFDFTFKYRLVSSYGESGAQVVWNGHRILIYFLPDYCRILTKNGQYRYSFGKSIINEWHEYKVEVRGDYATLYMDGKLMSSYELMNWETERSYIAFWLNRKDEYGSTVMDVGSFHFLPYTYNAVLMTPMNNSEYVSESEILCQIDSNVIDSDKIIY